MVNAKNSFRITRETRFLKKAGFPDLSGNHHMLGERYYLKRNYDTFSGSGGSATALPKETGKWSRNILRDFVG
jgi:hypothetical protein